MDTNGFLEKIAEYIEINEQTQALMLQAFTNYPVTEKEHLISEEDKIKAAYALNMCTVSVSQIIDYHDLNILEQEYEAILNNLNLEQMPKDDALLHILRQLLDTITYFRIEAGEREIMEKEYQQRMKNAIWASVPNFGMIVAGGNPITMAISLASQVGISYMNYRRNKVEYDMDREREEWQLQRTAIEQFNGLRRELFDTAWRLADAYGFPDGYRLTERQITRYNKILMDQDWIRKYERLESIKEDFEAYPPFWYFIGNAANYIAGCRDFKLSEETRTEYRKKALGYFDKFENLKKYDILRQDHLVAACVLEHIDLLLLSANPDINRIKRLLDDAVRSSQNAYDILELCALAYLKIGAQNEAARILRVLVNEDYNKVINAQLLSSIYVHRLNCVDYELLETRVDPEYLYPMPKQGESMETLQIQFEREQKDILKQKYRLVLEEYLTQYSIEWNQTTSVFDVEEDYPDSFFVDTKKAKEERKAQIRRLYADNNKKVDYQQRMAETEYELNILDILNEMVTRLFESRAFSNYMLQRNIENEIRERIVKNKDKINELQNVMTEGNFSLNAYIDSQAITLEHIVGGALEMVIEYAFNQVDEKDVNNIIELENNLRDFCVVNSLDYPEIAITRNTSERELFKEELPFSVSLFGAQAIAAKKNAMFIVEMTAFVKENINTKDLLNEQTAIYFNRDSEFDGYFCGAPFKGYPDIKGHAIMVLKDQSRRNFDLIFTTDGIVSVIKEKVKNLTPYEEVKRRGNALLLYRNEFQPFREYKVLSFDINILYNLIRQLGTKFVKNLDEKTEFIDGVIQSKILNQWFRERLDAMAEGVTRIYAIPNENIVTQLGYHFDADLSTEKNLIQCYYETNSGNILGLRVIRFENIDSTFQAYLLENGGLIRVM